MKPGNPTWGPGGGKGAPKQRIAGGKDVRNIGSYKHLNETTAGSQTGEGRSWDGHHHPGASHGPGMAEGGVSPDPEERGRGHGWSNERRLLPELGGQPHQALGGGEVGYLPGSAGEACVHPEEPRRRSKADRNTHLRGQGDAARHGHAPGTDLRAGFSRLLVRFPTGAFGAPGLGGVLEANDGHGRRLGDRAGYSAVLREARSPTSPGNSEPAGTRRSGAADDQQVAERGCEGRRESAFPGVRNTAGRGDLAPVGQHLLARSGRCLVREGGQAAAEGEGIPD